MTDANDVTRKQTPRGWPLRRTLLMFVSHAILFGLALFVAFGLYYNFKGFADWVHGYFIPLVPFVIAIKTIIFHRMRLYRGAWRYIGMRDLWSITVATHLSTFALVVAFFTFANVYPKYLDPQEALAFRRWLGGLPQSVFLLDWGMTIAAVCGSRIMVRLYFEEIRPVSTSGVRHCLIVGAGDTGEALLREIQRMPVDRYRVIGFLDDDPMKHGAMIHGVPVLGATSQTRELCERHEIEELLVALQTTPQKQLRKLVEQCQGLNVRFRTIPAMEAVIEGRVTVSQIRDVDIKDLLGREQVELDEAKIREYLHDERVLVTGAGGSIGSEICRQILRYRPACLVLVEQAENGLFEIDRDLNRLAPDVIRKCYIADICDAARVDKMLENERPSVIFHAAAHKHVPMMEMNVGEAIKNNVLGTRTIADAAKRHGVKRFVMISTDKAVNPTSVMGCSKRVAEMYIQQLRQGAETQYMTVRFGNVLGSSGSVVPIFAKQIAAGGPVTVTDPAMTRFFMTIPEASQLVLQAGVMGTDGDIFVLDMGEQVKIVDLAREMITLSGLRVGEDIEIKFTGIRPGEKLYEELSVSGENMSPTQHKKIYVWRNRKEDWPRVCQAIDDLIPVADKLPHKELRERLMDLVPEYKPGGAEPEEHSPQRTAPITKES